MFTDDRVEDVYGFEFGETQKGHAKNNVSHATKRKTMYNL